MLDAELSLEAGMPFDLRWLERRQGAHCVLVIAPHGGRRIGPPGAAAAHPKVNDLYTAAIGREIARRLDAWALINRSLDRNRLDANRIDQLLARAPEFLEMTAADVGAILARHARAVVLLIHGWNVIEPRVDLGLGRANFGADAEQATQAFVSARAQFIEGPLTRLARDLAEAGIQPSFGMRYPGAQPQNLLQAFTGRHQQSGVLALETLAAAASCGRIEAVQIELALSVRKPGLLRQRAIAAICAAFGPGMLDYAGLPAGDSRRSSSLAGPLRVQSRAPCRSSLPRPVRPRFGLEFYDPRAGAGGLLNFDLDTGVAGGRLVLFLSSRKTALFTTEAVPALGKDTITLGALRLRRRGRTVEGRFRGPLVVLSDGRDYLDLERALGRCRLWRQASLDLRFAPWSVRWARADSWWREIFRSRSAWREPALPGWASAGPAFGRVSGCLERGNRRIPIDGWARLGLSLTSAGGQVFRERFSFWTCLAGQGQTMAVEARQIATSAGRQAAASLFTEAGLTPLSLQRLCARAAGSQHALAERISVALRRLPAEPGGSGARLVVEGQGRTHMTARRPGPGGKSFLTTFGFAVFQADGMRGVGLFEHSSLCAGA